MTVNVTVFEVDFPALVFMVIVALQAPALMPFTEVPDTLQYFADEDKTFNVNFEVESTFHLRYVAMVFAVVNLLTRTFGATATLEVVPDIAEVLAAAVVLRSTVNTGLE